MNEELISISLLKNEPGQDNKDRFTKLKNDIIGSIDKKDSYFNEGLLETLLPMVTSDTPSDILIEILGTLNSYFFEFPRALECFKYYS